MLLRRPICPECPYASDEATAVLGAASEPPVKTIKFGADKNIDPWRRNGFCTGTKKTFVNQTILAVNINDTDNRDDLEKKHSDGSKNMCLKESEKFLRLKWFSLTQKGSEPENYAKIAKLAFEVTNKPLILKSSDIQAIEAAAKAIKNSNSVIASATIDNVNELKNIAFEKWIEPCSHRRKYR